MCSWWSEDDWDILCLSSSQSLSILKPIFVYPQANLCLSSIQSSEYAFKCRCMVSRCHTPFLILILLLSLCRWTVIELWCRCLSVVRCTLYTSSIPCSWSQWGQYCVSLHSVEGFLIVNEHSAKQDIWLFSAFLLQLVYDTDLVCHWVSAPESTLLSWLVFVECLF